MAERDEGRTNNENFTLKPSSVIPSSVVYEAVEMEISSLLNIKENTQS